MLRMLDARPGFITKFLKRSMIVKFNKKYELSTASLQSSTGKVCQQFSTGKASLVKPYKRLFSTSEFLVELLKLKLKRIYLKSN